MLSRINLWTADGDDLVIKDLPCGGVISIEEAGYRRKVFRTLLRRQAKDGEYVFMIADKVGYADAKEAAEAYVESNYHIWMLALHAIRPPLLLPEDEDE